MQSDSSSRITFILSSGRSGSTLLEMLLGSHPQLWSAGEVQLLPRDLREKHQPCGCGEPVSQCPFWEEALSRACLTPEELALIGHYRSRHPHGRVFLPGEARGLGQIALSPQRADWVKSYGEANLRLFQAIGGEVAEQHKPGLVSLIDSSKDLYRCNALIASGLFRIRIIHLVKDPRAFVYSMIRHHGVNQLEQTIRKTIRWRIENHLAQRVYRQMLPHHRSLKLRYEDLAGHPEHTIGRLWDFLGIDPFPEAIDRFRGYTKHDISGNPMKFEDRPIELDERWKTEMPPLSKWFVNMATGRWGRRASSL